MSELARTRTFTGSDFFKIVVALFLPPVAVLIETGLTGSFFINIILTLLGYIPGLIHAVWIIATRP